MAFQNLGTLSPSTGEEAKTCYLLRSPPPEWGVKPASFGQICQKAVLIEKGPAGEDLHPTKGSVYTVVTEWGKVRKKRGRKKGWRKTTKAEDTQIFDAFKKVRKPLGEQVLARQVSVNLPKKLRQNASLRTIRKRIAEKSISPASVSPSLCGPSWGPLFRTPSPTLPSAGSSSTA